MKKLPDVMIDLETLDTVANAVILSIGAVKFNSQTDEVDPVAFYASISIDSNLDANRRISEATLLFWLQQSPAAQRVFHEPKIQLGQALEDFSDWFDNSNARVWSNGADFDLPMLAHAYAQTDLEIPWKFFNSRCMRTMKNLPGAAVAPVIDGLVAHNALDDARKQALHLQAIYKGMR